VEIVALDAFSPADTVSASTGGTFTGNVDFDGTVDIAGATTTADVTSTKSAAAVSTLNRTTSDGDIQVFQKDGTTVGSIGTIGGDPYMSDGTIGFRLYNNNSIIPTNNTGGGNNNAVDLGGNGLAFRNLYLSGGVYLGGTGSANYLDDYEEGTFTPTITTTSGSITINPSNNTLSYTKIGRVVRITGRINVTSVSSPAGTTKISLPFAAESGTEDSGFNYGDLVLHNINIPSGVTRVFTEISPSIAYAQMRSQVSNSAWPIFDASNFDGSGTEYIGFNFTYTAA